MVGSKFLLTCSSCSKRVAINELLPHWRDQHAIRRCYGCDQLVDSCFRLLEKGNCSQRKTFCRFCFETVTHGVLKEHQQTCPHFIEVVHQNYVKGLSRDQIASSLSSLVDSNLPASLSPEKREMSKDWLDFDATLEELDDLWIGTGNPFKRASTARNMNVRSTGAHDPKNVGGKSVKTERAELRLSKADKELFRYGKKMQRFGGKGESESRRYSDVLEPRLTGRRPIAFNLREEIKFEKVGIKGSRSLASPGEEWNENEGGVSIIPSYLINRIERHSGSESEGCPAAPANTDVNNSSGMEDFDNLVAPSSRKPFDENSIFVETYRKVAARSNTWNAPRVEEAPLRESVNLFSIHGKEKPLKSKKVKPKASGERLDTLFVSKKFGISTPKRHPKGLRGDAIGNLLPMHMRSGSDRETNKIGSTKDQSLGGLFKKIPALQAESRDASESSSEEDEPIKDIPAWIESVTKAMNSGFPKDPEHRKKAPVDYARDPIPIFSNERLRLTRKKSCLLETRKLALSKASTLGIGKRQHGELTTACTRLASLNAMDKELMTAEIMIRKASTAWSSKESIQTLVNGRRFVEEDVHPLGNLVPDGSIPAAKSTSGLKLGQTATKKSSTVLAKKKVLKQAAAEPLRAASETTKNERAKKQEESAAMFKRISSYQRLMKNYSGPALGPSVAGSPERKAKGKKKSVKSKSKSRGDGSKVLLTGFRHKFANASAPVPPYQEPYEEHLVYMGKNLRQMKGPSMSGRKTTAPGDWAVVGKLHMTPLKNPSLWNMARGPLD